MQQNPVQMDPNDKNNGVCLQSFHQKPTGLVHSGWMIPCEICWLLETAKRSMRQVGWSRRPMSWGSGGYFPSVDVVILEVRFVLWGKS